MARVDDTYIGDVTAGTWLVICAVSGAMWAGITYPLWGHLVR